MTQLVAEHALAMKKFLTIVVSIFFLIKSYFNIKKKRFLAKSKPLKKVLAVTPCILNFTPELNFAIYGRDWHASTRMHALSFAGQEPILMIRRG